MKTPLLQAENRVFRTYRGGKQLESFLGKENPKDTFQPEDWISSFVEAKNKNYIPGEGITRIITDQGAEPITQVVAPEEFGPGRTDSGVLVKLLDAAERLSIQVHPTPEFSKKHFGTPYGKTECWHVLQVDPDADGAVYIGFKEGITKERFAELFRQQDIQGMLDVLHRFAVKPGDTILVRAGTPHAIGTGCFLLEIQEPCDYTMRVEKTTLAGEKLTPMQISYGLPEAALLDCFVYEGLSEIEARARYFLPARLKAQCEDGSMYSLVTYADTPCFALEKIRGKGKLRTDCFSTVVAAAPGRLLTDLGITIFQKGDKVFIPYGFQHLTVECGDALICYPPQV